jgi:hypothetical protein
MKYHSNQSLFTLLNVDLLLFCFSQFVIASVLKYIIEPKLQCAKGFETDYTTQSFKIYAVHCCCCEIANPNIVVIISWSKH